MPGASTERMAAMRIFALLVWLMLPIAALAYHLGPGQERQTLDDVAQLLAKVDRFAAAERWDDVVEACDAALLRLPKEFVAEGRRIVLERAKARMFVKQLPEAHQELELLVEDLREDKTADPRLV